MTTIVAALIGAAVLVAIWAGIGLAVGFDWPLRAFDGADGRPSTSKFQVFVWTIVIVWGYSATVARTALDGSPIGSIGIPTNLFLLMGLSAGTALAAKLVTVRRLAQPGLVKAPKPAKPSYRSLVANDADQVALEKVQVLAWTFVAVGVFVVSTWQTLGSHSATTSLPNVDDALLVLLGIGQATYVGVKALPLAPTTSMPPARDQSLAEAKGSGKPRGMERPAAEQPIRDSL